MDSPTGGNTAATTGQRGEGAHSRGRGVVTRGEGCGHTGARETVLSCKGQD